MSRTTLLFFTSFLFEACGGQIYGADSGTGSGTDASPTPTPTTSSSSPPSATCGPMSSSGTTSSNGDCTTSEGWSCGDTHYSVSCSCPSTQCTCSQLTSNGGVGTMVPYNGCPSCMYNGKQLAQLCGFPSQ